MKKIIEIYKDAFETLFEALNSDGFKFCASIIGLILLAVSSITSCICLANNGLICLLYLLGETILLLPVYVKLVRNIDNF